jgi:hypothetical protein
VTAFRAKLKQQHSTDLVRNVVVHLEAVKQTHQKVLFPAYVLDYSFGKKQHLHGLDAGNPIKT